MSGNGGLEGRRGRIPEAGLPRERLAVGPGPAWILRGIRRLSRCRERKGGIPACRLRLAFAGVPPGICSKIAWSGRVGYDPVHEDIHPDHVPCGGRRLLEFHPAGRSWRRIVARARGGDGGSSEALGGGLRQRKRADGGDAVRRSGERDLRREPLPAVPAARESRDPGRPGRGPAGVPASDPREGIQGGDEVPQREGRGPGVSGADADRPAASGVLRARPAKAGGGGPGLHADRGLPDRGGGGAVE